MKLNKVSGIGLLFFISCFTIAQDYQEDYLFPIKPGEQNFLAGNMSEIRPNHFHTGLDIKTDGRQGLPVYAIADGFVHRMKISSFGYGNVLYLKHDNGQFSLYAHLRDFAPEIASYIRQKMYEAQENELEYFPEPTDLPVKKGDIIAFSGNSGSSAGPHLHFEIRDSLNRALDPLKFGFQEIIDQTPPTIVRVAISPLTKDSRVNGTFQRAEFAVNYDGKGFYLREPVRITGLVGIEVLAHDKLDEMYNPNGFPVYQIFDENYQQIFESNVDKVDFDIGRFILVHTYRNRFTRLYKSANNLFDFYLPDSVLSGAISARPNEEKSVQVLLKDAYQNTTELKIDFVGEEETSFLPNFNNTSGNSIIDYDKNILIINGKISDRGELAKVYVHGHVMEIPFSYQGTNKRTYLWDMNLGVPDSVDICTEVIYPNAVSKIPFREETWFSDGKTQISFAKNSLLDDLFLRLDYKEANGLPAIQINDPTQYLWNNIEVNMRVSQTVHRKDQTHIYLQYANGYRSFVGGEWNNEFIKFKTRNFGTFVFATDSIPPTIRPLRVNSQELRFVIQDNLSGIQSFEARVNGEWVLMRYEYKQSLIWSEKLKNEAFKGGIILKVTDKANNQAIYQGII